MSDQRLISDWLRSICQILKTGWNNINCKCVSMPLFSKMYFCQWRYNCNLFLLTSAKILCQQDVLSFFYCWLFLFPNTRGKAQQTCIPKLSVHTRDVLPTLLWPHYLKVNTCLNVALLSAGQAYRLASQSERGQGAGGSRNHWQNRFMAGCGTTRRGKWILINNFTFPPPEKSFLFSNNKCVAAMNKHCTPAWLSAGWL